MGKLAKQLTLKEYKEKLDFHIQWYEELSFLVYKAINPITIPSQKFEESLISLGNRKKQIEGEKEKLVDDPKFDLKEEECKVYYQYGIDKLSQLIKTHQDSKWSMETYVNTCFGDYFIGGEKVKKENYLEIHTLYEIWNKNKEKNPIHMDSYKYNFINQLYEYILHYIKEFQGQLYFALHGKEMNEENDKYENFTDLEVFAEFTSFTDKYTYWGGRTDGQNLKLFESDIKLLSKEVFNRARAIQLKGDVDSIVKNLLENLKKRIVMINNSRPLNQENEYILSQWDIEYRINDKLLFDLGMFQNNQTIKTIDKSEDTKTSVSPTTHQRFLIFHYLFKHLEVTGIDRTQLARFIQFVTQLETGAKDIKNTNLYRYVGNPFFGFNGERQLKENLQIARDLFESIGMTDIAEEISKSIRN